MLPTNFNKNENNGSAVPSSSSFISSSQTPPKVKKEVNWLLWGLVSLVVLIIIGLAAGIFFMTRGKEVVVEEKPGPVYQDIQSGGTQSSDGFYVENQYYEEEDDNLIEPKDSWKSKTISEVYGDLEVLRTEQLYSNIYSISDILPSEISGYTSNLDELFLEDGTYNPLFSYWTKEVFSEEVTLIIEALTNPVFGGWLLYYMNPSPEFFEKEYFSELFTSEALNNLSPNDFITEWGIEDIDKTQALNRVFNVTNADFRLENDKYVVDLEIEVTNKLKKLDNTTIEKKSLLILQLVENPNGDNSPRVLINSSNIKII